MDRPNASEIRYNVDLGDGERADIHYRLSVPEGMQHRPVPQFIGVYVQPGGTRPGYWFTNLDSPELALRALWAAGCVERPALAVVR